MARLDAFLTQLVQYEADALHIESGDNLYLVKGNQRQPLMQVRAGALTPAHVVGLVTDAAPAAERALLAAGQPVAFEYHFMDRTFAVEVAIVGERYYARAYERLVVALGASEAEAQEAPSTEGAGDDDHVPDALERAIAALVAVGGSDLHLCAGLPPMARVDGEMLVLGDEPAIEAFALQRVLEGILPARVARDLDRLPDCDASVVVAGVRLRCSIFRERSGLGAVFRVLAQMPPTAAEIAMPEAFIEHCCARRGLVVIAGVAGSGRSTAAAAMLDWINTERALHIVTLENPIEIVHERKRSIVHQRDASEHAGGFARGLRAAAREDADVIYVSDVREREVVELALDLAEAGRLVIVNIDAISPQAALERLVDAFPRERQERARAEMASTLTCVISPSLHTRLGGGRVATFDVVPGSPFVSECIRTNRIAEIHAWPLSVDGADAVPASDLASANCVGAETEARRG